MHIWMHIVASTCDAHAWVCEGSANNVGLSCTNSRRYRGVGSDVHIVTFSRKHLYG